ncbi:hypothetical protein L484_022459 [Morus notabilis]|uniref:Uncharacterized protein n=1 Tax=Morus notabilis TaxID=981085 RepID=W9QS45_9ROSA|nr:hypothetical protein L484_022459 [Morus notabilis]
MAPEKRENDALSPSKRRPMGAPGGRGGSDRGLKPDYGFWALIHELRSSISLSSDWRLCLRTTVDLGFLMLEIYEYEGGR